MILNVLLVVTMVILFAVGVWAVKEIARLKAIDKKKGKDELDIRNFND